MLRVQPSPLSNSLTDRRRAGKCERADGGSRRRRSRMDALCSAPRRPEAGPPRLSAQAVHGSTERKTSTRARRSPMRRDSQRDARAQLCHARAPRFHAAMQFTNGATYVASRHPSGLQRLHLKCSRLSVKSPRPSPSIATVHHQRTVVGVHGRGAFQFRRRGMDLLLITGSSH